MAFPAGRTPEEDEPLQRAMRVLPGGGLGAYYSPQELAFMVREARPITDYRATLAADRGRHAAFTRELWKRGVVKAARKFHVSLAHGETEVERTLAAVAEALSAATESTTH